MVNSDMVLLLLPPPITLTFSACLLLPLGLRIPLRVFQARNGLIAGWLCLQSWPVSYTCVLLSLRRPLPNLLHKIVPPLALQTQLLPETVWLVTCVCHFRSPGLPAYVTPATSYVPHFLL
jgi:hypothetical protein